MTYVPPRRKSFGPPGLPLLGWVVLMAAVLLISAGIERTRLSTEFESEASILHRLLSQRADQHDAHMTALSALASADGGNRPDLFLQVAVTIIRFYPRITAVDLVPLTGSEAAMTTRAGLSAEQSEILRAAALGADGRLVLRSAPWAPGRYLLIKRSPNSDQARFALSMEVDGAALMDVSGAFWSRPSVHWTLLLPDGVPVAGTGLVPAPGFQKALGSQSQPLVLQADFAPGLADLLPAGRLAAIAVLATLGYLVLVLGLGQYARARRAERQAYLSAQEARLAHASRVNTLGEMASGIAHELTQPLTAILSQAQAARHLSQRGDVEALAPAMQGIADQAKRASAILERLRNWTVPAQDGSRVADLVAALQNVRLLLQPDADRRGVALSLDAPAQPIRVRGDQVELEQIVFNLIRNAIEATSGQASGAVNASAHREGDEVVVEIGDNGPGIAADLRDRLFEPFVSGKAGGTGLGLALCQRLAERMGGEVVLVTAQPALFRLRLRIHDATAAEATP